MRPIRLIAFTTFLSAFAAVSFAADNDRLFITGGSVGGENSNYGLAGVIAPLPGSQLGKGWVGRFIGDALTYRYESGTTEIDATSYGADLSLGWMDSDTSGWWGIYAGPVWRTTDLSPDDLTSESRGEKISLRLSAEGDRAIVEKYRANAIVSYNAFSDNGYWSRLRILRNVGGNMHLGPEGTFQGSDDYRAYGIGLALTGISISDNANLGFSAGMRKSENVSTTPYVGVEFSATF